MSITDCFMQLRTWCSCIFGQRRLLRGCVQCVCIYMLCVYASELAAIFSCVDPVLTHMQRYSPLRTDRGNSSDADKWARSRTDSPAGNTAVKPVAAAPTTHRK